MRRLQLALASAAVIGLTGCLAGLQMAQALLVNPPDLGASEAQPTVEFVNALGVEVCSINLWRDQGPVTDQTANWLELTDVFSLQPGERVSVGMTPRDAEYHLRAINCDGLVISESVVRLTVGQSLVLGHDAPDAPAVVVPPSL